MKKFLRTTSVLVFLLLIFLSCRNFRYERDLSPIYKDFLSKVRYIITRKEKKVFYNLLPSEREKFIEQFWKKRDPDPDTEINELKERYFSRIEEANHLFKEGATPGWLQDRGRIYILLGPPEERFQYPTGYSFYDKPSEVWYYGFFPIVFVDQSHTQDYELTPLGAQYLARLLSAQLDLKPEVKMEGVIFDYKVSLKKISVDQIKIQIKVPYKHIWLTERGDKLETALFLHLDVLSKSKEKVWGLKKEFLISFTADEADEIRGKSYIIPVDIKLTQGKYLANILLENKSDGKKVRKTIKFNL